MKCQLTLSHNHSAWSQCQARRAEAIIQLRLNIKQSKSRFRLSEVASCTPDAALDWCCILIWSRYWYDVISGFFVGLHIYTEQTIRITDLSEDILALITSLTQWVVWWFVFQDTVSHAQPKSNPSLFFHYFQNCFWFFTWLEYFLCLWLSCTKWSNQWTMNDAKTKNVWIILRQLITKKDLANLCWRAQGPIVTHEKSKVKILRIWYITLFMQ